jgi:hypothetical protein
VDPIKKTARNGGLFFCLIAVLQLLRRFDPVLRSLDALRGHCAVCCNLRDCEDISAGR